MKNELSAIGKRRIQLYQHKKNKAKWIVMIMLVLIGILIFLFLGPFVFSYLKKEPSIERPIVSLSINEQAELETQVVEGAIAGFNNDKTGNATIVHFKINTKPKVDENNNATILLENDATNAYLMAVEITLDSSNQVIYRSKYIKPGSYLDTIPIAENLNIGEYPATAHIGAIDPQTLELLTSFEQPLTFIKKQ